MPRDRILIADDESDIALILKLQLEDAGYTTFRAKDGVEAIEQLGKEHYELLLLDIRMPRMDGLQVLKQVRQDWPEMVVVMMTAHGSEEIAVTAMKQGALDYISKPFSNDDMLKRIERALDYNRTLVENKKLHLELEAEQKRSEAIIQGMAELLIAVDTTGKIITMNRMAEFIFAKERHELINASLDELLDVEEFPADGIMPLKKVLESGEPAIDISYSILSPTGKIPVLSSAAPLYDNNGNLLGAVEIIRDISSLKALEREREDFVSMLSHDLKNPITSIVGSLDLVREGRLGPINDSQREFIEAAEESCGEMVEMINSLLDIHKFEAGRMVMKFQQEPIDELLEKVCSQFNTIAEKEGVRLTLTMAEILPTPPIDRTTFLRLMGNLLSNAIKFTKTGGEIKISASLERDLSQLPTVIPKGLYPNAMIPKSGVFLKISVSDSGVGIHQEALGTIFDRFVQAQNRREGRSRGTGLGLAFCRKVMDAHKGIIWAESTEGVGSRFSALFPTATDSAAEKV